MNSLCTADLKSNFKKAVGYSHDTYVTITMGTIYTWEVGMVAVGPAAKTVDDYFLPVDSLHIAFPHCET